MSIPALLQRLFLVEMRRFFMVISLVIIIGALFQGFSLPYKKTFSLSPADEGSIVMLISNATFSNNLEPRPIIVYNAIANHTHSFDLDKEVEDENETKGADMDSDLSSDENEHSELTLKVDAIIGKSSMMEHDAGVDDTSLQVTAREVRHVNPEQAEKMDSMEGATALTVGGVQNGAVIMPVELPGIPAKNRENMDTESRISTSCFPANVTFANDVTSLAEIKPRNTVSITLNKKASRKSISTSNRQETHPTSISQMNSLLLQSFVSSHNVPQWASACDRQLLSAKLKIQNAPNIRSSQGLHASAFRNVSMFKRSYELMERLLKVYVYKEGEKPIFHQSKMRGIYASEGWFMKHIEGNKKFLVKDPRKAHLFFLPFSPQMLRTVIFGQKLQSQKDLEEYLKNYVDLVARKYSFWNRTGGTDHFLVGCHDWASRITRKYMQNCIRVLCNANVAKGFKIGKDTTLPVTYIRSAENPLKDVGGKHPSERYTLAFFAGGMHGYLRPILVQFWENKESDMKIFGPMPRDIEGKRLYREYMKSSKYCICARGYEVHTPRIVEAILYECVPVIISDNYVPPFFEVLNWEAFSVFVQEKDIPNLRSILLSIPEEKYLEMQLRVKMVQQHFLWHKNPVKYDLFHMILHSVWHNRIFQMKNR
ncbi:probable glycosyltransferase At3g07620 isoform X2 [Ricinus communis]|uniref:probable glycosyltransferase At3g07620 isoform X2 n=1 Tax=Ricinus communis TaxID=3988 RepID=UPI00201B07F7|nr:probable glycosyltransferase At3g07620 isoform X2 [Ricinus communis]